MDKLGFSGDSIVINGDYIFKICETNQQRFAKNSLKQQTFQAPHIKSVPILEQGITSDGKNFIKMPYLQCGNSIIWLSKTTTDYVYELEFQILEYFKFLLQNSQTQPFDQQTWVDKITDLESKIQDTELKIILHSLKNWSFINPMYYGNYHGDLTLSNLLIHSDDKQLSIDAVDFLESFMHTPINDLVKIRQDTRHLWTLNLIQNFGRIDINRVLIFLRHIDSQIEKFISQDPILSEYYLPFQIVNLMRILPYNKDRKIFQYLKNEIKGLFNELNANHAVCR